jgi:hypothetical protein
MDDSELQKLALEYEQEDILSDVLKELEDALQSRNEAIRLRDQAYSELVLHNSASWVVSHVLMLFVCL